MEGPERRDTWRSGSSSQPIRSSGGSRFSANSKKLGIRGRIEQSARASRIWEVSSRAARTVASISTVWRATPCAMTAIPPITIPGASMCRRAFAKSARASRILSLGRLAMGPDRNCEHGPSSAVPAQRTEQVHQLQRPGWRIAASGPAWRRSARSWLFNGLPPRHHAAQTLWVFRRGGVEGSSSPYRSLTWARFRPACHGPARSTRAPVPPRRGGGRCRDGADVRRPARPLRRWWRSLSARGHRYHASWQAEWGATGRHDYGTQICPW
jgi:hypothetical protein